MSLISKIITIITIVLLIFGLSWLFFSDSLSLINTQEVSKSFSQFVTVESADEYVVAKLISNEEFTTETYNKVMELPVGDTNVKLSLVAHYKYYIKLGELTHNVENGIVFVHVPKLYLSTPVAFEFSTVQENCTKSLFGTSCQELFEQLKKEVSLELITKGKSQVGTMYEKAAKSLADNLSNYFNTNGYSRYYKSIVVVFSSENSQSQRQFNYSNSFCGKEPCSLELNLGKGLVFTTK